ncbi:hypothetical protein EG329_012239 [Mollisiaceae sp. DMI_Dod_QoI]|nr:hypothetical protein EG329_012239 [Helotiales sp. DMI_Dod_QoI]
MSTNMGFRNSSASVPEVDAEKTKTKKIKNASADAVEAPAKKRKATEDAAPMKVKKSKTPKTTINETVDSDPANNDEIEVPVAKKSRATKISTKSKKGAGKDVAIENNPKSKTAAKGSKLTETAAARSNGKLEGVADSAADSDEEDSEIDDQTEALLEGFESDGDDEDALNEEGMPAGESIPERKQLSKAQEKKLKKIAESGASDKPGVVYVGRIPHGFYEHEMRAYFKQFGNILKLRLSRNKKTGASKHHAWIQFESATVADIVARTMDNYLMFGHLLKVKLVPDEQVHEDLFKGANKRFKKVPWNKLEGRKIEQGASEETWNERVDREEKRRDEKAKKLKNIGYEFDAPKVKSAKGVSKNDIATIEPAADGPDGIPAIEAAPVTEEPSKTKKKSKKSSKSNVDTEAVIDEVKADDLVEKKKKKKEHRAAATPPTVEDIEENLAALAAGKSQKPKNKAKKSKAIEAAGPIEQEMPTVDVGGAEIKAETKKSKKSKKTNSAS